HPHVGQRITKRPLGGKPQPGAAAGTGKRFVNIVDNAEIEHMVGKEATVTRRWPTAGCKNPVAMAIDTTHHRLFSGCRSGVLAVSDYNAGRVVTPAPIGMGVDGAAVDAATGAVFTSNGDGTLTAISEAGVDQ